MSREDIHVIELIEYLQDIVDNASKVPITGKVVVDKKEMLEALDEIMNYLPDEIKKAQWVMSEKERILAEATTQLETIKVESVELMKKKVENHDVVNEAKIRAQEIVAAANRDAKTIRLGAREYADEILCQLEKEIEERTEKLLSHVKTDVEQFAEKFSDDLNRTTCSIRDNIKELRNIK